jgi:hypothetical protein
VEWLARPSPSCNRSTPGYPELGRCLGDSALPPARDAGPCPNSRPFQRTSRPVCVPLQLLLDRRSAPARSASSPWVLFPPFREA